MFRRAINLFSLASRWNTKCRGRGGWPRITIPSRRLWVVLAALAFGLACLFGERFVPAESVSLYGHTGWTKALHFSPDGRALFAISYSTVARWELGAGSRRAQGLLELPVVGCSAMAGDGSTVALEHPDGTVTLHDGCTDRSRIVISQRRGTAFTLALSRDASTLAAGSSEGVRLWDTQSGRPRGELQFDHSWVTCLEFGHDGRTLAVHGAPVAVTARTWVLS
jgi:WD40 repeat protein